MFDFEFENRQVIRNPAFKKACSPGSGLKIRDGPDIKLAGYPAAGYPAL